MRFNSFFAHIISIFCFLALFTSSAVALTPEEIYRKAKNVQHYIDKNIPAYQLSCEMEFDGYASPFITRITTYKSGQKKRIESRVITSPAGIPVQDTIVVDDGIQRYHLRPEGIDPMPSDSGTESDFSPISYELVDKSARVNNHSCYLIRTVNEFDETSTFWIDHKLFLIYREEFITSDGVIRDEYSDYRKVDQNGYLPFYEVRYKDEIRQRTSNILSFSPKKSMSEQLFDGTGTAQLIEELPGSTVTAKMQLIDRIVELTEQAQMLTQKGLLEDAEVLKKEIENLSTQLRN